MPFDSSEGQGEYLINQWLRPFKPKFTTEAMDRFKKGFGQVKVRDPLDIFFPLAAPQNRRAPINIPTYTRGTAPVMDEGSSDVGGHDTGIGNDNTSTPASTVGSGSATPPPSGTSTFTSTPPPSTTSTIPHMSAGTPFTMVTTNTGGGGDLGCNGCKYAVIGDDRLPCLPWPGPCLPLWGGAVLCGFDGTFCPAHYGCGSGAFDCFCGGVNCMASVGVPCNPCTGSPPCPAMAAICCYDDGTLLAVTPSCCACS